MFSPGFIARVVTLLSADSGKKNNNSGESRSLLASVEVKDSTVVAGNKQENAPDTDTSSELIKDLTGYFGSYMPQNRRSVRRRPLLFTDRFLSSR